MTARSLFLFLLLSSNIRAEDQLRRVPRKIDEARYCKFDAVRTNYNATDLLGCIDELAVDLADRESDRTINGKDRWNDSTGRQISFMDIFSSLFNNDPATSHQSSSFPANPTSGYQQSNYPSGTVGLSPGFQLNLLEALSTISRHDDYKCVPRILCEMASGKLPGRSLGKQGSGFFEFLGRDAFTDWLTRFDAPGVSPLLNFGRAMILGYSHRGNSLACYDAFPKCPKRSNALVYYLNNYKGGFFRLFNRFQGSNYRRYNGVPGRGVEVKGRVVTGISKGYFQNAPLVGMIQYPVEKDRRYFGKAEFPRYDEIRSGNDVVFPGQGDLYGESTTDGVYDDVPDSGSIFRVQGDLNGHQITINVQNYIVQEPATNIGQNDDVPFFPQQKGGRKFSVIRFP